MVSCWRCQTPMKKGDESWWCQQCGFAIPYSYRGYRLTKDDITALVSTGSTPWIHDWRRRDTGSSISGRISVDASGLSFQALQPKYSECPLCKHRLLENKYTVYCSSCSLEIWKTIAGKELSQKDIHQLILYRKSDLIKGFIQKESGKYFSAHLTLLDDGSVTFS